MRNRSIIYKPYDLLRCIRVLTLIRPTALEGSLFLAGTSGEVIARATLGLAASTSSRASLTSELRVASSLMAGG